MKLFGLLPLLPLAATSVLPFGEFHRKNTLSAADLSLSIRAKAAIFGTDAKNKGVQSREAAANYR
jgi:hypothetical protein